MAYAIGSLLKNQGLDTHYQMLQLLKNLAEDNGWTVMRWVDSGDDWELILRGEGLTGEEQIFVGFKTYQSQSADYYNILTGVFTGYVPSNPFESQPGARLSGCPAHNNAIDYWISINPQRIVGCFKVGVPVYEHFYVGKFLPYARPSEYPYPVVSASMLNGATASRFDSTTHVWPYPGYYNNTTHNQLYLRDPAGNWTRPTSYPWQNQNNRTYALAGVQGTSCLVPAGDYYQIEPVIMYESRNDVNQKNVWGELDGVYFCSGFNNGPENVVQIGGSHVDQTGMNVKQAVDAILAADGRAFVLLQNVRWQSWSDFIALEMK